MPAHRQRVGHAIPRREDVTDPNHQVPADPGRGKSPGAPHDHGSGSPDAPSDPGPAPRTSARAGDRFHVFGR